MRTALCSAVLVAAAAGTASGADLIFNKIAQIDVSPAVAAGSNDRIGSNVSAIAWNGSRLFLAGFNNSGASLNTGLMEVFNPLSVTPTFSARFGTQTATANGRGHSGLAIAGNSLAVGYDSGGSLNGYSAYDVATNTQTWNRATLRGFTGPAFDPGFAGSSPSAGNVAYSNTGSGRRGLLNTGTGADIYTLSGGTGGFIWNNSPAGLTPAPGTNNRDLAFDPATGDIYGRSANSIIKGIRNGDNSLSNPNGTVIFAGYPSGDATAQSNAANTNQQNLAFVDLGALGNFLIFNDRPTSSSGSLTSVIRAIDTSGAAKTIDFGSFSGTTATRSLDFSWDSATQTLAVGDSANSQVYIFAVIPSPGGVSVLALGGLVAARRRRR